MTDEARVPAWVTGELPQPDGIECVLYCDDAERIGPHRDMLQRWHDTVAMLVLPEAVSVCLPPGAPEPRERFLATEQTAGVARRARVRRWSQGLTEDLSQLQAQWWMEVDEPYMTYSVGLYAFRYQARHLKLSTTVSVPAGSGAGVLAAMVELAVELGHVTDFAYGQITVNDHGPGSYFTRLDVALHRSAWESADASRTVLRGYEWVTVLPSQLLARVGGAGTLRSCGAFVDVVELRGGGALLRATDITQPFAGERVRAVANALLPILPPMHTSP